MKRRTGIDRDEKTITALNQHPTVRRVLARILKTYGNTTFLFLNIIHEAPALHDSASSKKIIDQTNYRKFVLGLTFRQPVNFYLTNAGCRVDRFPHESDLVFAAQHDVVIPLGEKFPLPIGETDRRNYFARIGLLSNVLISE